MLKHLFSRIDLKDLFSGSDIETAGLLLAPPIFVQNLSRLAFLVRYCGLTREPFGKDFRRLRMRWVFCGLFRDQLTVEKDLRVGNNAVFFRVKSGVKPRFFFR